jgi:glycosyltransferase involved in cell wall biosynthesis
MSSRVSVVIPSYNAEAFIADTLRSVLAQSEPVREVLVVDDGSRDRTPEIVAGFGPPVALHRGPRRGVCAARNTGIALSTGEYVALCDHDDTWAPEKTRKQIAVLDADPALAFAFTQAVNDGGPEHGRVFPLIAGPEPVLKRAYEELLFWNYVPMSAVIARRTALDAARVPGEDGPFDPRFRLSEDWELWLRLAERGGVGYVAEPLMTYRIVSGRATERMADLRLEDLAIFEDHAGRHPEIAARAPRRVRREQHRIRHEAGWWLLREGRAAEARPLLLEAWRLRPFALRTVRWLVAAVLRAARA